MLNITTEVKTTQEPLQVRTIMDDGCLATQVCLEGQWLTIYRVSSLGTLRRSILGTEVKNTLCVHGFEMEAVDGDNMAPWWIKAGN